MRDERGKLFAVRGGPELRLRLAAAAREDGLTVAAELSMLLDLREQWGVLTAGAHPLGRPAPIPPIPPPASEPVRRRRVYPPDGLREGVDYWVGRGYWHPDPAQRKVVS
jgi:hypothetical protein